MILVRLFYIKTFVNFQIRNVGHSKISLFEILTPLKKTYENPAKPKENKETNKAANEVSFRTILS